MSVLNNEQQQQQSVAVFPPDWPVLCLDLFMNSPGKCYISSDQSLQQREPTAALQHHRGVNYSCTNHGQIIRSAPGENFHTRQLAFRDSCPIQIYCILSFARFFFLNWLTLRVVMLKYDLFAVASKVYTNTGEKIRITTILAIIIIYKFIYFFTYLHIK